MDDEAPQDARSDELLVRAVNRGEEEAFEALYRRYRDWVLRTAWRFTGHEDDAHDVLQETFAYVLGKFPGFRLRARFTTFLYPVVRHNAQRISERRRRHQGGDATIEDVAASRAADRGTTGRPGLDEDLAAVVDALPAGQREVLLLRFVDGFSLAEIAEALELPLGTVKSRLHHAVRALREDPRTLEYFREE